MCNSASPTGCLPGSRWRRRRASSGTIDRSDGRFSERSATWSGGCRRQTRSGERLGSWASRSRALKTDYREPSTRGFEFSGPTVSSSPDKGCLVQMCSAPDTSLYAPVQPPSHSSGRVSLAESNRSAIPWSADADDGLHGVTIPAEPRPPQARSRTQTVIWCDTRWLSPWPRRHAKSLIQSPDSAFPHRRRLSVHRLKLAKF